MAVNFWGTLVSPQQIDFAGDDYLELSDAERDVIFAAGEADDADDTATGS